MDALLWRTRARMAIAMVGTPCYVLSEQAMVAALTELTPTERTRLDAFTGTPNRTNAPERKERQ